MSFLSAVEAIWQKDEAWVVNFFATLKKDVQIVENDLLLAINWLSAHEAEIASDVASVVGIAAAVGLGLPPPVSTALQLLNTATAAVNAAAAAAQSQKSAGNSNLAQVAAAGAAAYQAVKASQVGTAQALAHVASTGAP